MRRLAVALCSVFLVAAARADQPVYYAIEMNQKPIGYSMATSNPVELEGRKLLSVQSQTVLKVALLGAERQMVRRSQTTVDATTGLPVSFRVVTDTNGQVGHIECEFTPDSVKTWAYADAEDKGEPTTTALPENTCILGSNNFGHWGIVLRRAIEQAKEGSSVVSIFLPDVKQTAMFALKKVGVESIEISGQQRSCEKWSLQGQGVTVLADADSRQLLRMDLPAQQTTVTLADPSVVRTLEHADLQEVLAQNFIQSNVTFDDMMKVAFVQAEVDVSVFGSGPGNEAEILQTAMQHFEGEKTGAKIKGTVSVRTVRYQGEQAPDFPSPDPPAADLAQWVRPAPMIESDDPDIAALAKQLTEGATTRWEAVQRAAAWVEKEIQYAIADAPSARLALKVRKGDCGPHSTLLVAMLRSLNIPAKLVGGVIYTPSFGGTFGQHAWVEVHMGKAGWVSLDPTTGETEQMNATHLKFFEGMGGVLPTSIEVIAYDPANRELSVEEPTVARPLPWKNGQDYVYQYTRNGQDIGKETFRFNAADVDGQPTIQLHDTLDLADGAVVVKGDTLLVAKPNSAPISFHRGLDAAGRKYVMDCEFAGDVVKTKITGAVSMSRDVKIDSGVRCFDNNLIGSFALICSQLSLESGKTIDLRAFHPSSLQILSLSFQVGEIEKLQVGGQDVECFKCVVEPLKNDFWISRDGRLLQVAQGPLVIKLGK